MRVLIGWDRCGGHGIRLFQLETNGSFAKNVVSIARVPTIFLRSDTYGHQRS